jgi:hypothetical protein
MNHIERPIERPTRRRAPRRSVGPAIQPRTEPLARHDLRTESGHRDEGEGAAAQREHQRGAQVGTGRLRRQRHGHRSAQPAGQGDSGAAVAGGAGISQREDRQHRAGGDAADRGADREGHALVVRQPRQRRRGDGRQRGDKTCHPATAVSRRRHHQQHGACRQQALEQLVHRAPLGDDARNLVVLPR